LLTLLAAVLADIGRLIGASSGRVAFLRADTAGTLENTGLGTIDLVVSEVMCQHSENPLYSKILEVSPLTLLRRS